MTSQTPVSETQQVTSQTPATKQKNPKRIAAGIAIAERTKQAREAQKKALADALAIIANNQLKQSVAPSADPPPVPDNQLKQSVAPSAEPPPVPDNQLKQSVAPSADPPPAVEPAKIATTQWLSVISIIVSLVGLYYKREEIKSVFTKNQRAQPPSPVLPRAPPPSPVDASPKRKVGIRNMD